MNSDALIKSLKANDFQDSDILDLFGAVKLDWGSVSSGNSITIGEPNNPDNFLIQATIKSNKVTSWKCGPAFTQEVQNEILKLAQEIRAPFQHAHIMSRIMFSRLELLGNWKFENKFQVLPCIHEIKVGSGLDWTNELRSPHLRAASHGPPYPFLLEVSVPKISNDWLQMQIGMKILDNCENMFCTFLKGVSNTVLWPNDRQWTALKAKNEFTLEYHLLRSGIATERGGRYDTWTHWHGKEAPIFEENSYIDSLLPYKSDQLVLPKDLKDLFGIYFGLNEKSKRKFSRSIYYFTVGQKFRSNFDLAVMNYSIAIECLSNDEEDFGPSKRTGKSRGGGHTQKFKNFLIKYAPVSAGLIERRDMLYKFRSNIAHGLHSAVADISTFSLAQDRDTPMMMEWLVRKSLVGWLSVQNQKKFQ